MKLLYFLLILLLFYNCDQKENLTKPIDFKTLKEIEYPKTDIISLKRGYNNSLIDYFYNEALNTNKKLLELDRQIENVDNIKLDSLKSIQDFERYNNRFYNEAYQLVLSIKDTTKVKKIKELIEYSKLEFDNQMKNHIDLINLGNKRQQDLNDLHIIMKLITAEKYIKVYQEGIPSDRSNKNVNAHIEELINKTESYINEDH